MDELSTVMHTWDLDLPPGQLSWTLGGPAWRQELDLIILVRAYLLGVFYDSIINNMKERCRGARTAAQAVPG